MEVSPLPSLTWDYLILRQPPADPELQRLGQEGWELCAAAAGVLYFKRRAATVQERITADQRREALAGGLPAHRPTGARLLHPGLRQALAEVGHTDLVLLADRGFPIPPVPRRIELGLSDDVPTVLQVLAAAAGEVRFDRLLIADEMREASPHRTREISSLLPDVAVEWVPHAMFKAIAATAAVAVRTADATPYANTLFAIG